MLAANTDLCQLVAAAADLCRKPLRHAVRVMGNEATFAPNPGNRLDCCLRLEVRTPDGERLAKQDLELELFYSGQDLNLTISWCSEESQPLLWQGSHPIWMDSQTGNRCNAPQDGVAIEALARRLRALLQGVD